MIKNIYIGDRVKTICSECGEEIVSINHKCNVFKKCSQLNKTGGTKQNKPLLEDVKGMDMHPNNMHTSSHKGLLKTADIFKQRIKEE